MKSNIIILVFLSILICPFFLFALSYSFWFVKPAFNFSDEFEAREFSYQATFDMVFPLYALVSYKKKQTRMPIVVIMHEYTEDFDRYALLDTVKRFSDKEFFVVAPDMRGRGKYAEWNLVRYNIKSLAFPQIIESILLRLSYRVSLNGFFVKSSAGKRDSAGKEIHDIFDAIETVKRHYTGLVDETNVNIIGYSGGGGNVLSAVTKAPDYFNVAVSYFGISDYSRWYNSTEDDTIRRHLHNDIGGPPDGLSTKYKARSSLTSATNNQKTYVHLFVDEDDTLTPRWHSEAFHSEALNSKLYLSKKGDSLRYFHGSPSNNPPLVRSEENFLREMKGKKLSNTDQEERMFRGNGFLYYHNTTVFMGEGDDSEFNLEWKRNGNVINIIPMKILGESHGFMILHHTTNKNISIYENQSLIEDLDKTGDNIQFSIQSGNEYKIVTN